MANEEWMKNLPDKVRNLPIIDIAIPGSHNSMTYGITTKTAPDADASIRRLNYIFPCFVRRWAKTQSCCVIDQLKLGVRYFDLRICQKKGKFYYAHGLYAMEVFEPLEQLRDYLDAHTEEFVIIDLQHFYAMDAMHHIKLHALLLNCFGNRLYTLNDGSLPDCTLNRCKQLGKTLLIIYRRCPLELPKEFWPSFTWATPWPNVDSSKKLEDFLKVSLQTRTSGLGYVSQCVLTPSGRYITLRFYSSLRKTAKKVNKRILPWIETQSTGPFCKGDPKVNILIADFVNLKDGLFCNSVIELNRKLNENDE